MIQNLKVNFIGAGASRCGTTWLSRCLAEHPDICFSRKKETHFFHDDNNYKLGMERYAKFYSDCKEGKIKGEFTPGYFAVPDTAERIHKHFPNAKLIFSFRNPVNRAYSEYFYNIGRGLGNEPTFREALDGEFKNRYYKRGCYYSNLQPFLNLFSRENILIMVYEDIKNDPITFMQKIYEFLGVDSKFIQNNEKEYINNYQKNKKTLYCPLYSKTVKYLKKNYNQPMIKKMREIAKPLGLTKLMFWAENKNYKHKGETFYKKPPIEPSIRHNLLNYYKDETEKLEEFLKRDLGFWKK